MKRPLIAGAGLTALIVLAVAVGPGSAGTRSSQTPGVTGNFSLIQMVHQTQNTPSGPVTLPGVNPWDGSNNPTVRYTYRSIPCTGPAPVNNIASDLPSYNNRVRGSRSPSSMRAHPFTFKLVKVKGRWRMRGQITFTVCKLDGGATKSPDPIPDANKPKIVMRFDTAYRRVNPETLRFNGVLKVAGGTGRYADLTGKGTIAGYLFCFGQECAKRGGKYLDGQFAIQGDYRDPTPDLAAG